jgi:hypothetical protein
MTVHVITQRKVVEVGWDTKMVLGSHASMQVNDEEKRNVDNDGKANLTFPNDFVGSVDVTVSGSKSGSESGTVEVV